MSFIQQQLEQELRTPNGCSSMIADATSTLMRDWLKGIENCSYLLNEYQKEVLREFFCNKVTFSEMVQERVEHPVMNFCGKYFKENILKAIEGERVIGFIGTSYKEMSKVFGDARFSKSHIFGIFGVHDERDFMRIIDGKIAALKDLSSTNKRVQIFAADYLSFANALENKLNPNTRFCCTKYSYTRRTEQAAVMVAMESLYDMNEKHLFNYMCHFGARKVFATVITCYELANASTFHDPQFECTFRLTDQGYVSMTHDGVSTGYVHKARTFFTWTLHSRFHFDREALVLERVAAFGSYTMLNIYRVPHTNATFTRQIASGTAKWVQLWDVVDWITTRKKRYFWVLRDKWDAVFNFATRQQAENYDPAKIFGYAHGKLNCIILSGKTIQIPWITTQWVVDKTIEFAICAATFRRGEAFWVLLKSLSASKKGGFLTDLLPSPVTAWFRNLWRNISSNSVARFFNIDYTSVMEEMEPVFTKNYPTEYIQINFKSEFLKASQLPDDILDSFDPAEPMLQPVAEIGFDLHVKNGMIVELPDIIESRKPKEPEVPFLAEDSDDESSDESCESSCTSISKAQYAKTTIPDPIAPPPRIMLVNTQEPTAPEPAVLSDDSEQDSEEEKESPNQIPPEVTRIQEALKEAACSSIGSFSIGQDEDAASQSLFEVPSDYENNNIFKSDLPKDPLKTENTVAEIPLPAPDAPYENLPEGQFTPSPKLMTKIHQSKPSGLVAKDGSLLVSTSTPWEENSSGLWGKTNSTGSRKSNRKERRLLKEAELAQTPSGRVIGNRFVRGALSRASIVTKSLAKYKVGDFRKYVTRPLKAIKYKARKVSKLELTPAQFHVAKDKALEILSPYASEMKVIEQKKKQQEFLQLAQLHAIVGKKIKEAIRHYKLIEKPTFNVDLWDCKAGAGKTTRIVELFNQTTDCYIVGTNEMRLKVASVLDKLNNKIDFPWHVWTFEKAFENNELFTKQRIFIDEIFLLPLAYIYTILGLVPKAHFVFAGDVNQLRFNQNNFGFTAPALQDVLKNFTDIQTIEKTFRFSKVVCELINAIVPEYGIKPSPKVTHTTQINIVTADRFRKGDKPKCDLAICASHDTRQKVNNYPITITTAQGQTADSVNLYVSKSDLFLMNQPDFLIVSLSRAKYVLNIIEVEDGALKSLPLDFQALLEATTTFVDSDNVAMMAHQQVEEINLNVSNVKAEDFNADTLESMLLPIHENFVEATYINDPEPFLKKVKLNPDGLTEQKQVLFRILSRQGLRGRCYKVSSRKQTVLTFLERMSGSKQYRFNDATIERGLRNFKKLYLKDNVSMLQVEDLLRKAQHDIVEKYRTSKFFKGVTQEMNTNIEGHLKTIIKTYVNDAEKIASGKAGQSISAMSKEWNLIFAPFFRALSEIKRLLYKDNVCYANGYTPAELKAKMQHIASAIAMYPGGEILCMDIEKMDAQQKEDAQKVERQILESVFGLLLGDMAKIWFPLYWAYRETAHIFAGDLSMDNNAAKLSGDPNTFGGNTDILFFILACVLNENEFVALAGGGDDSLLYITLRNARVELKRRLDALGVAMKYEKVQVPMFFNQFFDPKTGRLVYDPLRLAWSLFTKNFTQSGVAEQERYVADLQEAVRDKLVDIKQYSDLSLGGMCANYGYDYETSRRILEQLEAFTTAPASAVLKQTHLYTVQM